ncbi:MAG: Ig-like domain-containing protein, partial [Ruminococcus sp.]|nr:Ig-like domain-containing protein [Ruminococcus sp.]
MKIDKVLASALSFALGFYTVSAPSVTHAGEMTANADFNYEEILQNLSTKKADDYSLGDVNNDKAVDSKDASLVLAKYSAMATGGNAFTEDEKNAADVDRNKTINSSDASYILSYYAYNSTAATKMSMEEYMKKALNIKDETETSTTTAVTSTTSTNTATTSAVTNTTVSTSNTTATSNVTSTTVSTTVKPVTTTSTTITEPETTTSTTITEPETTTSTTITEPETTTSNTTTEPETTTSTTITEPETTTSTTTTEPETTTSTTTTEPETTTSTTITEPETTTSTTITEPETTTSTTITEPEITTTTVPQISEIIPNLNIINCTVGYEDSVRVEMLPENAENKEVSWESSDEEIVSVNENGEIIAKSAGSCIITVTSKANPDVKAEITINVTALSTEAPDPTRVQRLELDHEEMDIALGYLDVSYVSIFPTTAIETGLEWTSSDEDIATVDNQGWITARKAGTCVVTVRSMSNPSASASVIVHIIDPYAPKATAIELSNRQIYFDIPGETMKITANIVPEEVTDKRIIWSSSDESVAVVDENGNITSTGKGECVIIATCAADNSITAGVAVEVIEDEEIGVESIDLSNHLAHLEYIGQKFSVTAHILPENAVNKKIEWVSSNNNVATVDSNGNITAVGAGTCIITAKSVDNESVRSTVSVEVSDNEIVPVETMTLTESKMYFTKIGEMQKLSSEIYPENASDKGIIWQSSDESVATVDEDGCVTAEGNGTCIISATSTYDNSISASAEINVSVTAGQTIVEEVQLTETSIDLIAGGESKKVSAVMIPVNAPNQDEIWTSSDTSVATVNENGLITPVGTGTCLVTVKSVDNPTAKASVTVHVLDKDETAKVKEVNLTKTSLSLVVGGQSEKVSAVMLPVNAPNQDEIWTTSDAKVATVNENGLITPVGAGACTVTVTSADNPNAKASLTVTVTNPNSNQVTDITLSTYKVNLTVGGQSQMPIVTMTPSTASDKSEIWTSSDTKVATVNGDGLITPVGAGTCTVTVKSKSNPNVSASVAVTVTGNSATTSTITGISLSKTAMNLTVGQKDISWVTMTPTTAPETLKGEIWTSSNTAVATVDAYGNVTAVGAGTCVITVTSSNNRNVSAKINVTVTGGNSTTTSTITGISLSKYTMNLTVGQKDISWVTMTPTTAPESLKGEIWTSSNTAVATVDTYGNVTAVGAGTCVITVTSQNNKNVSAKINVTVTGNSATTSTITGISLSKTSMNLTVGQKDISWVTMTPTTAPETLKGEIWTSSNTAVATVDAYGNVTAVGAGTCTITVTSQNNRNVSAKINVTVTGNSATTSTITGISLSKTSMNLTVGQKDISWVTMTPTTAPETLKGEIWTSSNTAVATVDAYGNVTAVGAGTCVITVTSQNNKNVSAKINVTVTGGNSTTTSTITGISLSKTSMNLTVGQKDISWVTMTPTTAPETLKGEIWTSSNTAVATVDAYGNVTAVGAGTCTITVTSQNNKNVSAKINVTVTGGNSTSTSTITGISLSKTAMNLTVGQKDISWVTMTPTTAPETLKGEIWTSSNTAVATVDAYGNVTAVGAGTCVITVTSQNNKNVSAKINVTVTGNSATTSTITGISLSKYTMNLTVGQKDISWVTMTPTTAPETLKGEIWTSSNTAVATVDAYGNVTAVGAGTCTITVTSQNNRNVSAKITVTVTGGNSTTTSTITGISLSKTSMNLTVGQKDISWVTMTPTTAPETLKGEIWTSSNTAVATVDAYGNVTAVGAGTCVITVTSQNNRNVSAKINVTVTGNSTTTSTITGISLSKTSMNLTVGQKDISWVTMTPTTAPETLKGEIWTSSNTAVATVDAYGNVTAVGAGTCVITVTSQNNRNVSAKIN